MWVYSKSRVQDPGEFSALRIMFAHLELSRKRDFIPFLLEVVRIKAQVQPISLPTYSSDRLSL